MNNIKQKKVPYGISDYRTIVEENYLYIDKTKYIELFESLGAPYIFFLRPRRFGKSLFMSILEYYYDINAKSNFEKLFRNTYIGKNETSKRNSYYVLKFNFSGINTSTKENLLNGFTNKVINGLTKFEEKYNFQVTPYNKNDMPSDIFDEFLTKMSSQIDTKLYVMIDEYDHFANELLSFQVDVFEETVSKTGFVRKWYEVLKSGTDNGLIQRIFATGVSPVTLDSLTSGFNIARNKTTEYIFNECLGFTEEEVINLCKEYIISERFDIEKELPKLKQYYNGYLFNKKAKTKVFNSDMILYYLSEYNISKEEPEQLIDTNISSDYKKIANLFNLKNKEQNYEILQQIIEGIPQDTAITAEFSLAKEFSRDDFNSLLFYLGFLTMSKPRTNSVELVVPNYVIKELYFDFFGSVIKEQAVYDLDVADIRSAIEKIALYGDIKSIVTMIETTLNKLSNRDFIKFDEKYIKLIMITYFMMSKIYFVKSEYEVEGGFIDIALLKRSGVVTKYNAIFEVKYIKKNVFTDSLLQSKIKRSKRRIK